MAVDFQLVQQQVSSLGDVAVQREQTLEMRRRQALDLLEEYGGELERLREKVRSAERADPGIRCALPVREPLDSHFPLPAEVHTGCLLAADGSQITPSRHEAVLFGLVNVGGIRMVPGSPAPPETCVKCLLYYGDDLEPGTGGMGEDSLSLERDLMERELLAQMAKESPPGAVTLTDGPLELWGATNEQRPEGRRFLDILGKYQEALLELHRHHAAPAGYVDKPAANLVVRLLEVAKTGENEMQGIKNHHPLLGVREQDLYEQILEPGERTAVFAMQSQAAKMYRDVLGLHFFYLNVGRPGKPWLARVEVPRWVAENKQMLDDVHAVLVRQSRILGTRPYPYLLHRAHEAAVVSLDEREQVSQMIVMELRRRGVRITEESYKQGLKGAGGRRRHGASQRST